jgi:transposase
MIIDLPVRPGLQILVTSRPVDFRRGMDSLSTLVKETLTTDPYAGDVFVFRAKRADRLKILVWDGSGLVLLSKRLERGRFTWPAVQDGAVTLSAAQLTLLFSGLDWSQVVPRTALVAHQSVA